VPFGWSGGSSKSIGSLEHEDLVRRSSDTKDVDEIEYEFAENSDEDVIAGELPVVVTELGLQTVDGWLNRTRRHFGSWPPERPDAVG
jgi:hypothetical protein